MLIQLPRGSSDQPGSQNAEDCDAFEAALRRDLASAPVVSYETVLGGGAKRALDLTLTIIAGPFWVPVLLGAALWSKARHAAPVFQSSERIGYGGVAFQCFSLRVEPPSAVIERLRVPGEAETAAYDWTVIANQAESPRAKWRRALERLPRLINVLLGEMSLVGPSPLAREQLEPLKTAKRHYLSARPGVMGVSSIADADGEEASQYKLYALSWSLSTDALIMWDALNSLRHRGQLWRPTRLRRRAEAAAKAADQAIARRRGGNAA